MGKPTGFVEWQRLLPKKRAKDERLADSREFIPAYSTEEAGKQAGRHTVRRGGAGAGLTFAS